MHRTEVVGGGIARGGDGGRSEVYGGEIQKGDEQTMSRE